MAFLDGIVEQVRRSPQRVVFPEGEDPRILEAADRYVSEALGEATLIGRPDRVREAAKTAGADLDRLRVLDVEDEGRIERGARILEELRRAKGMTIEEARYALKKPEYQGATLLRESEVDAFVCGCATSTADVARSLLHMVRTRPGIRMASSFMAMELPDRSFGENGVLFYADIGFIPDPSAEQLADIALATSQSYRALIGGKPRIAMLSFSTHGSARHRILEKVVAATERVRRRAEHEGLSLEIDGEMQADAALVPDVAARKCPNSPVGGRANILIFPDLNAGNISYKITERLAHARAYGPVFQGFARPASDLSRGARAGDIFGIAAIVACQAANWEG